MKRISLLLCLLALSASARGKCFEPAVMKGLRIHEWGVFLRDPEGIHARAGADTPTFFQKVVLPAASDPDEAPDCCREPVLHIYAPKPTHLDVKVRFPGGMPTVAWPRAEASWLEGHPMLSWSLQVGGEEGGEKAVPPRVPESHWISDCRNAGSDLLRTPDGKDAEHFLLYEGDLDLKPQVEAKPKAENSWDVSWPWPGDAGIWILQGGEKPRRGAVPGRGIYDVRSPARVSAVPVEPARLRVELAHVLVQAGLSEKEAEGLLSAWIPELLKPGTRLAYLLPRAEYDRLLPITFDPAPEELARVGLVIQELNP